MNKTDFTILIRGLKCVLIALLTAAMFVFRGNRKGSRLLGRILILCRDCDPWNGPGSFVCTGHLSRQICRKQG